MEEPSNGMGRRQQDRQQEFWIATDALDDSRFDRFVEALCQPFCVASRKEEQRSVISDENIQSDPRGKLPRGR